MTNQNVLEEVRLNVKLKLAALWTSFMFVCSYIDYFHLYMPGKVAALLQGKILDFPIGQGFLLGAFVLVCLPALMIFLSVALRANVNRRLNLLFGTAYIPFTLLNLAGEAWIHMVFGAMIELCLLSGIIYYAWHWPRQAHGYLL